MTLIRNARTLAGLFALLATTILGCSDDIPTLEARRGAEDEPVATRLNLRQLLRYGIDENENGVLDSAEVVDETIFDQTGRLDVEAPVLGDFGVLLGNACELDAWEMRHPGTPYVPGTSDACGLTQDCSVKTCWLEKTLCSINLLLDIAASPGSRVIESFDGTSFVTVLVPPQTRATAAGLQEYATFQGSYAGNVLAWQVSEVFAVSDPMDCASEYVPGVNQAEAYVNLLHELWQVTTEASRDAVEGLIAIADSERGSTGDITTALRRAYTIRAHAAALLLGVTEDPLITEPDGLCTSDPLTRRGLQALDLLHRAALPPADVMGIAGWDHATSPSVSIEDIVTEVAERDGLLDPLEMDEWTVGELYDRFGLDEGDFIAARRYLAEEIWAFRRSTSVELADIELPNMVTITDRYAATSSRPIPLPVLFASELLGSEAFPLTPAQVAWAINVGVPQAIATAEEDPMAPAFYATLVEPLRRLHSDALRLWSTYTEVFDYMSDRAIFAAVDAPANQLVLVSSPEALRCALLGTVEGVDCDWADVNAVTPTTLTVNDYAVQRGLDPMNTIEMAQAEISLNGRSVVRWPDVDAGTHFILRLRSGDTATQPGAYESVAAIVVDASGTDKVVSAPATFQWAGQILTPDPYACGVSKLECAEASLDERIPLEGELTDDGDAIEDSWRRNLDLAHQAADEADALGQRALAEAESIQTASEGELRRLVELCGVSLRLDVLRQLQEDNPGEDLYSLLTSDEIVERSGDLSRLAACLSDDSIQPFTSLGDQKLCVWYSGDDPRSACVPRGPNGVAAACPSLLPLGATSCTAPNADGSVTYTAAMVGDQAGELLGYFVDDRDPATSEGVACDYFKSMRFFYGYDASAFEAHNEAAWEHNPWLRDPELVEAAARRVSFEADIYTTGTLRAGFAVRSLGDRRRGVVLGSGNTCPPATGTDCTYGLGIFCDSPLCGTDAQRAAEVERMTQAVSTVGRLASHARIKYAAAFAPQGSSTPTPRTVTGLTTLAAGGSTLLQEFNFDWSYTPSTGGGASGENVLFLPVEGRCRISSGPAAFTWTRSSTDYPYTSVTGDCGSPTNDNQIANGIFIFPAKYDYSRTTGFPNMPVSHFQFLRGLATGGPLLSALPAGHFDNPSVLGQWTIDVPWRWMRTSITGDFDLWFEGLQTSELGGANDLLIFHAAHEPRYFPSVARPPTGSHKVTPGILFDALELLCEAARPTSSLGTCQDVAAVTGAEDLHFVADQLQCLGGVVLNDGQRAVFYGLPVKALDATRQLSGIGGFPATGGELGVEIGRLRSSLVQLAALPREVATVLEVMAADVRSVDASLRQLRIVGAEAQRAAEESMIQATTACRRAKYDRTIDGLGIAVNLFTYNYGSVLSSNNAFSVAARACEDSNRAIADAAASLSSQLRALDAQSAEVFAGIDERARRHAQQLADLQTRLRVLMEQLDQSLAEIDKIRLGARESVARAMFLSDPTSQSVFASNAALRRRLTTTQERFLQARERAIRAAFVAKRSVEQRLGVRLAELRAPMYLLGEAPSSWESDLCERTGIDYTEILSTFPVGEENFSGRFIGDYVDNLEAVVESYAFDFPYNVGRDTVVASMQHDIYRVREMCMAPSVNILVNPNRLDVRAADGMPGWSVWDSTVAWDPELPIPIRIDELDKVEIEEFSPEAPLLRRDALRAFTLTEGVADTRCSPTIQSDCPCTQALCGWDAGVDWGQVVELGVGVYRLSWYARGTTPATPEDAVYLTLDGSEITPDDAGSEEADNGWTRYWQVYDLGALSDEEARVLVRASTASLGTAPAPRTVDVAGVMLEQLPLSGVSDEPPGPFEDADEDGNATRYWCEDTDGSSFRGRMWTRGCERLCTTGFGTSCSPDDTVEYCYRETRFFVDQDGIERGETFRSAGFARGNFNYRIESVAVNFVGSSVRLCDAGDTGCFNAGFVPYSIDHVGPFPVRNYQGNDYDAPLFDGRIEHARGLAAERVLTNPVSSADGALIGQYMRDELRGRPLTGTYRLRVWEEPGVNFDGIEDVQIVFNYRYWTRAN